MPSRRGSKLWMLGLLSAWAAFGCAGPTGDPANDGPTRAGLTPPWIAHHPDDPEFPRSRFLTAIGSAAAASGEDDGRRLAEEQARAEIARTLRSQIRSTLRTYLQTVTRNETHSSTEGVSERIESNTEVELRGAEVVRSWLDPNAGRVWVKVVLSKEKYASQLLAKLQAGLARIRAGRQTASEATDVGTRLLSLLAVYQESTEQLGELAQLVAVIDRAGPLVLGAQQELIEAATMTHAEVTALRSAVNFSIVSGDGQAGSLGGALPHPIVVNASTPEGPLSGFPVRFGFPPGGSDEGLDAARATDAAGNAECRVLRIPTEGLSTARLEAWLDFSSLAPDYSSALIPVVAASFQLPTLRGARVAVHLTESNGEASANNGAVAGRLVDVLSRRGVRFLDSAPDAASSEVQYLLTGSARAIARPRQTFYFSYAEANVELVDAQSGAALVSIRVEPNGAIKGVDVNSQNQAGVQALARLGDHLASELDRRLRGLFAE